MRFDDATRAQIEAARPDASTWLAANAGSGKTRVLTDRVARLLLSDVSPEHILCLTYTKAAASEMQNRLFKRLGAWAMLGNAELRDALAELGIDGPFDSEQLRKARRLFALAIETPGGLKIQTIHSFCASLLRRFPLEAGVSPQFTEIEDRAADLLRADILDEMSAGADAPLVSAMARIFRGDDFGKLTKTIVGMREAFSEDLERADVLALLDQPAQLTRESLESHVFKGDEADLVTAILPALRGGGATDKGAADRLERIAHFDLDALPELEKMFLFGKSAKESHSAKIGKFPTKATQTAIADYLPDLEDWMRRVEDARPARLALEAVDKTLVLHAFAGRFIALYEAAKQRRGWLDFDDLILRARALLTDRNVAAWVLYRIDGGIDHILVDEAQDTSRPQWDVIETLTGEFFSGAGARPDTQRTIFVVGDKKQSIYSFQGADPQEFDRMSAIFEQKITEAHQVFQHRSLDYSFRSSSAILRLVDTVFDRRRRPDFDKQTEHIAFKENLPGRVDLWPLVPKDDSKNDQPWTDPLDRLAAQHETVVLADQIAARIKQMIDPDNPTFIADDGREKGKVIRRPVEPGDFLILVQRRSSLFAEIIRACKAAGLPIAGADRLKVGGELAVRDLAALLSFLATPDDSLSLATALKSPLFGWSEQQVFDLAHRRSAPSLWQALRGRDADFPRTLQVLNDLRGQVDFLRPYDLIERMLTRHDGRRALLARLGPEAEDGINAMLSQALAYERTDVPSLTGFIEWMQTDALEIKRQIDSASNQIRVMTVHGSKGLEAPIVILPDTGKRVIQIRDEVIRLDGTPFWKPASDEMPEPLEARTAEIRAAQEAERLRLLYVAMTRAEKWLIVAAAGNLANDGSDWFQIIAEAMDHVNAVADPETGILRFQEGDWDSLEKVVPDRKSQEAPVLEPVFSTPVPLFAYPAAVLPPSDLGGPKALPGDMGEDTEAAMAFGTLVHSLLEKLPGLAEPAFLHAALRLTERAAPQDAERALSDARRVLDDPALASVFAPGSLPEVALTGWAAGRRMHGVIDRLIIEDDRVLLVDFKTNRTVPETPDACPEGILRQMGAYVAMLAPIYPDHRIEAAILWTAVPRLMLLPQDLVTAALKRAGDLDVGEGRS